MKKKIISLLMALTMAASVVPATVSAESETSPEIMHFHVWWDDYRNASDAHYYVNAPASGTNIQGNYVDVELHDRTTGADGEIQQKAADNTWSETSWGYTGLKFSFMGKAWQSDEFWGNLYNAADALDTTYVVAKIRPEDISGIDTAYLAVSSANGTWGIEEWVVKAMAAGGKAPEEITRENYPELTGGVKIYNNAIAGVSLTDYYDVTAGGTQTIAVPLSEFVNSPDMIEGYVKDCGGNFYPQYIEGLGFARKDSGAGKKFDIQCTYLGLVKKLDVPTSLTAVLADSTVDVSWNAVSGSDITYKVERSNGTTTQTVYEGADTQFTDVLSGAGTFEYTVKSVFTTPDEYKKKNPASSKAGDVVVESEPSSAVSVTLDTIDASTLVVHTIDTPAQTGQRHSVRNVFVGDYYISANGKSGWDFNEEGGTNTYRVDNVPTGKIFRIHDNGYGSVVGQQITKRPTKEGEYIIYRKTYEADGYVADYVGENWGFAGFQNTADNATFEDISVAKDGYAIYTISITEGSCLEDAYLALSYVDTDASDKITGSDGKARGVVVVGVPLEDYYDVNARGMQTVAVPLSAFEFSENEDVFTGVAADDTRRGSYSYFKNKANWKANKKVDLSGYVSLGVAREDANPDKLESFEVTMVDLVISKAPDCNIVLTAENTDAGNALSWTKSGYTNTTYKITKSNGTTTETIDAGNALSYVDANIAEGDYTYTVTALVGDYGVPAASNSATVTVAGGSDEPVVPDEPEEDSAYTVVEDMDWENWQVEDTDTNLLADRAIYVSDVGGEENIAPDNFWNDYQGWWMKTGDVMSIEINDTGYSENHEGDIATKTVVTNTSGSKEVMTIPTSDGVLWGYKGSRYFLGDHANIPENWRKDRWFGIKDISGYENTGYFAFDVEIDANADVENAYFAIEVATKASEVANKGITLPVTDEQIANNTNKWETKTTFVVGVPLTEYYDVEKMGRQKVYVPISEFINSPAMREMYSKSTSRVVTVFAENLENCPTDLRLFHGMGIAKKNSKDYETNPKAFNAKVYSMTIEVPNVKEPTVSITEVNLGDFAGKAWDVVVSNFDAAKDYIASFVDGEESKTGEIGFDNVEADGGSVAFAIFLHTSRANVALDIAVQ